MTTTMRNQQTKPLFIRTEPTMEAVRRNADWDFFKRQPFGILMAAQTLCSLYLLFLPLINRFVYDGGWFAFSLSWFLFLTSLIYNLFHVFGFNRRTMQIGSVYVFMPCALIVFFVSAFCAIMYAIASLMCLISLLHAFSFGVWHILCTLSATSIVIILTLVNAYLTILLFRAAPNSQLFQLTKIVIEGSKTEFLEGEGPQFSPSTPNAPSQPQHPQFSV